MNDLLECPWCGLETQIDDDFESLDCNNVLTVYCQHCDGESYSYVEFIPYFNPLRKSEQK